MDRPDVLELVLTSLSVPYGRRITAAELATALTTVPSSKTVSPWAFRFFTELPRHLQDATLEALGLKRAMLREAAEKYRDLAGWSFEF